MKQFILLSLIFLIGCDPKQSPVVNKEPMPEVLTVEQTAFIKAWCKTYNPKGIPVLAIFRNRYFHKTDIRQLHDYLKRQDTKADFSGAEAYLKIKTELGIDTAAIPATDWISNKDVETCDKVDPDFWGCFNLRESTDKFYYLSMPLFSSDKKWCLLHVALQHRTRGESFGGGRLYHLEEGKWEEKAFLSNWGKQPE